MKKLVFFTLAATIGLSCSEDSETLGPGPPPENEAIHISAVIAEAQPLLKTTITGNTASWANGDAIGLFCPQSKLSAGSNVKFTASGAGASATWSTTAPIYWVDGTTSHQFTAYAPYAAGNTNASAIPLPSLAAQTGTLKPAQDFLVSRNLYSTGIVRTANVGLVFTHALSLVEFKIKTGNGITANSTLANFVLAGSGSSKMFNTDNTTSKINLTNGTINPGTTSNTITVTPSTPPTLSTSTISLYALVLPGEYSNVTLQIEINEGGTIALDIPAASVGSDMELETGKKSSYTVTVSRTAITISNPTITDWTNVPSGNINVGI